MWAWYKKVAVAGGMAMVGLVAQAEVPEPDVAIRHDGWQVVINLPQTRLFVYVSGALLRSYPVAVGKMLTKTPTGSYSVTGISHNPTWHVPKSIQQEMKSQGKPVQAMVSPGPSNPLGPVFIRIGAPELGLGMHGTNAPGSVPGFRSHGCVRMKNDDALELAGLLPVGSTVTLAYQSVLLNEDADGNLWMTAYRDQYLSSDIYMQSLAQALLKWQHEHALAVHGRRVNMALKQRNGKPVCLTCDESDHRKAGGSLDVVVHWQTHPSSAQSNPAKADRFAAPPG